MSVLTVSGLSKTYATGFSALKNVDVEIRRGEIGLMNPNTSEQIPVEAIAGKVQSDSGELTAVVTILHDMTEALEKARLYEQLERGAAQLDALRGARHRALGTTWRGGQYARPAGGATCHGRPRAGARGRGQRARGLGASARAGAHLHGL